jgi:hypothetical protein
MMNREID